MVVECSHCHKPLPDIPFIEMINMELAARERDEDAVCVLLCEDCFDDESCTC